MIASRAGTRADQGDMAARVRVGGATCLDGGLDLLQGLALGASADDALYVWPGFKSNVTIKKCRTVELDLENSNLELFKWFLNNLPRYDAATTRTHRPGIAASTAARSATRPGLGVGVRLGV